MSSTTKVRAKERRRRDSAQARSSGSGGFLPIPTRELRRLLSEWGWEDQPNASGGHQYRHRWPLTGDAITTGDYPQTPRVVLEKVSTVMRVPIKYVLEGPTTSNPYRERVLEDMNRRERRFDRGDYLEVKHESETTLVPNLEEAVDEHDVDETSSEPELVDVDESVSEAEVERFVALRERGFLELEYAERREFLDLRRRLTEEGLFMPEVDEATRVATTNGSNGNGSVIAPRRAVPLSANDVEPTAYTPERTARMVQGRKASIETRKSSAPKPGKATTVDEVLERGTVATPQRRAVLETLVGLGGEVADQKSGLASTLLGDLMERAGLGRPGGGLLRSMEDDHQIGRETNGKRTYRVFLLDPIGEKSTRSAPERTRAAQTSDELVERRSASKAATTAPETSQSEPVEPEPIVEPEGEIRVSPVDVVEPPASDFVDVAPKSTHETPEGGTLLEVKFVDRSGRIFLETEDGSVAVADGLRWV